MESLPALQSKRGRPGRTHFTRQIEGKGVTIDDQQLEASLGRLARR
jgi:hypothetical protein